MSKLTVYQVARICHQANKALCESHDDHTQVDFDVSYEWQKNSAIQGVQFALDNPNAPASAQHDSWLAAKEKDGWKFGPVKDGEKKEHPCMVSYDQLPEEQKAKDHLFKGIVNSLREFMEGGEKNEKSKG